MSFILDALKKSESERQRQSGPALFEVKIAPPRSRFATWGGAIAALLAINFLVVGFVLWRGNPSRGAAPAAAPGATAAPAAQAPSGVLSSAAESAPADARFGARTEAAAAALHSADVPAAAAVPPNAATAPPVFARASAGASTGASDAGANPDDLAPAVEPRGAAAGPSINAAPAPSASTASPAQPVTGVIRATASGLPTYQDAAAEPGANIPNLSLDLHVYSPQPDQRFVFLNMLKLREGDTSPQGVRVEQITPDGVILSYQGKEFVLQRH